VQNSASNRCKTSFLGFRVPWLTVLFIGRCVREGWRQLKERLPDSFLLVRKVISIQSCPRPWFFGTS